MGKICWCLFEEQLRSSWGIVIWKYAFLDWGLAGGHVYLAFVKDR